VLLKAELFQRTGSFKPRGVLNKLASLSAEEKRRGVIGISAGNHAQALAYAAGLEGIDALLVMWRGASEQKITATRGYDATVDLEAGDPAAAFERLAELIDETGRTLVHPFDDPLVIAGQGTVGLEILEDGPVPDVVLAGAGGGGLISGIAVAVKARNRNARVVAVEPEGSTALHSAFEAGHPVPVTPNTAADALTGPFVGDHCFEICRELGVESVLVSEDELSEAFRWTYARTKLACELGGAAPVAALLAGKAGVRKGDTVVAVVSGGNIAPQQAAAILAQA
jgi:threonine dehydratase